MLKITEKVTRYDIENLDEKDYSLLVHLVSCGCSSFRGRIAIEFAVKILKKEDVMLIYQIDEKYYNKILSELTTLK